MGRLLKPIRLVKIIGKYKIGDSAIGLENQINATV